MFDSQKGLKVDIGFTKEGKRSAIMDVEQYGNIKVETMIKTAVKETKVCSWRFKEGYKVL